jgi:hypothetical protein
MPLLAFASVASLDDRLKQGGPLSKGKSVSFVAISSLLLKSLKYYT